MTSARRRSWRELIVADHDEEQVARAQRELAAVHELRGDGAAAVNARLRLGVRAAADADGSGLTPRERDVLRLVAVDHTNREIARELYLSQRTVDMHVRNVLRKLDCRTRVEAAVRARELGLSAA